jgi:hypothetical protein
MGHKKTFFKKQAKNIPTIFSENGEIVKNSEIDV